MFIHPSSPRTNPDSTNAAESLFGLGSPQQAHAKEVADQAGTQTTAKCDPRAMTQVIFWVDKQSKEPPHKYFQWLHHLHKAMQDLSSGMCEDKLKTACYFIATPWISIDVENLTERLMSPSGNQRGWVKQPVKEKTWQRARDSAFQRSQCSLGGQTRPKDGSCQEGGFSSI